MSGEAKPSYPPAHGPPAPGFPLASVLICYADVIAGSHARTFTLPELSVTVDLSLDVVARTPLTCWSGALGHLAGDVRAGKRIVVTETAFTSVSGETLAVCTGSFSRISRTVSALGELVPPPPRHTRQLLDEPLAQRVGLVSPSSGVAEIARRPDLGNTTDSLMGGLSALQRRWPQCRRRTAQPIGPATQPIGPATQPIGSATQPIGPTTWPIGSTSATSTRSGSGPVGR